MRLLVEIKVIFLINNVGWQRNELLSDFKVMPAHDRKVNI